MDRRLGKTFLFKTPKTSQSTEAAALAATSAARAGSSDRTPTKYEYISPLKPNFISYLYLYLCLQPYLLVVQIPGSVFVCCNPRRCLDLKVSEIWQLAKTQVLLWLSRGEFRPRAGATTFPSIVGWGIFWLCAESPGLWVTFFALYLLRFLLCFLDPLFIAFGGSS